MAQAPIAVALDASSIDVPTAVAAGSKVPVKVSYVYGRSKCSVSLVGPKAGKAVVANVKDGSVRAVLSTKGLPVGAYKVKVACGGNSRAVSDPIHIVPKGEPLKATCDVVDKGFSLTALNEVNAGFVVHNASSVFSATRVRLSANFRDAAGNIVLSMSPGIVPIPPGKSVLGGIDGWYSLDKATGATTMEVVSTCESSESAVAPAIVGAASVSPEREGIDLSASITNTLASPLKSGDSTVSYVVRNAAGAIVGGDWTFIKADVPVGGQTLWTHFSSVKTVDGATAEYLATVDSPY